MRTLCLILALVLGALFTSGGGAEARSSSGAKHHYVKKVKHVKKGKHTSRHAKIRRHVTPSMRAKSKRIRGVPLPRSRTMAGIVAPLAAKVRSIQASCGSAVISAVRHGARVRGSGRPSLHASGRAVDVRGNPSCIYANLKGWTNRGGGYSRDYSRVGHVHISYGGREAGLVFAHYGHRSSRYASRRHRGRLAEYSYSTPYRVAHATHHGGSQHEAW